MKKLTILSLAALVFLASCGPKTEGTDAEVSEAKEVTETSLAAATYKIRRRQHSRRFYHNQCS